MKKKSSKIKAIEKSIFRSAGEVIGSIGHGIAEGRDKIVEVAHIVSDKFSSEEKKGSKSLEKAKKKISKKLAPKKAAVKKTATKLVKKIKTTTKKTVNKAAKKVKKAVKKK